MKYIEVPDMIQLTARRDQSSPIMTTQGEILFLEWLLVEKKRIEANPARKAQIVFGAKGYLEDTVALYVNRITGCNCKRCNPFR